MFAGFPGIDLETLDTLDSEAARFLDTIVVHQVAQQFKIIRRFRGRYVLPVFEREVLIVHFQFPP